MARIAVVGAGAWGTALSIHAAKMGHAVTLWVLEPDLVDKINREHCNELYLPNTSIPESITASNDFSETCCDAELIILACPSKFLRATSAQAAPHVPAAAMLCVVTKGIENETLCLMTEVIEQTMPNVPTENICVLSGPSFAVEVARGLPTDVVAASPQYHTARKIQPLLHSPLFRVYTSDDPVGVQLGGSLKNVIAIAAGACDAFGLGNNARAALITRGLAEIARLGVAKGANPITFLGLAGIGDLILTCTSDLSRNHALGKRIALGEKPEDVLSRQRAVAEGFYCARAAYHLARGCGVDMPITEQVYSVLYEGKSIPDAALDLMNREFKDEFKGIVQN